ncbi:MAG: GntG family PLP-dependent aldolase [Phycisphaerales bacterium]|nr:GntG family PLP-dependent aldolase [Phycisphaerales bacterium]
MIIDLRSDTVTKPTPEMLAYMMKARVGDDVYGDDESTNELETTAANIFGKQAGLFCASGTLSNQLAIKAHTNPGEEVLCAKNSHVYLYECGGIAVHSACSVNLIDGDFGRMTAKQVAENIRLPDIHNTATSLVVVENTNNRGGGSCYELSELEAIKDVCHKYKIAYHMDGARIFNACVAKHIAPISVGVLFDSVSICLSKGLGAPVGSLLLGTEDFIQKARKYRKLFGGGMRQSGYLAAAGMYALVHHVDRLKEDHDKAQAIFHALASKSFINDIYPVATNIIIFSLHDKYNAHQFHLYLKSKGILTSVVSNTQVRMVTHLDVSFQQIDRVVDIIKNI